MRFSVNPIRHFCARLVVAMAVAPPTMEFVPAKKKVAGWDSKDSLCEVYFASCQRLGCTANSEVVRQLVRRAKLLAPLPTHRIEGLSRAEMLDLAFDHMDLDGSGTLSIPELVGFARGLNPIKVHGDVRAMIKQMDKDGDNKISKQEYLDAMRPIADALVDEEFQLGILETLASVPDIDDLPDRESKLAAVFRHLDVDGSGSLDQEELVAIFMDGADPDPARARRDAEKQLRWLDTDADGVVSQVEFVEAMLFLHAYMSDEDFHAHCEEMMREHKHVYDFSNACLGPRGVEAVLPALARDATFTHVSFRGCGVRNATAALIAEHLAGHPSLQYLDVGQNPVSEGGALQLALLVERTPSLREARVDGCHFTRGFSDVSENLDPEACVSRKNAARLREALAANRLPPPPTSEEEIAALDIDAFLYARRYEVKALFKKIAAVQENGDDGKVSFAALRHGLATLSSEWNALSPLLTKCICPERVFGHTEGVSTADLDGDGLLSYAEFARALRREGARVKVAAACKKRRTQLKVVFYALAGDGGRLSADALADGVEGVLVEQAEDHWGFSAEEMRSVINRELFRGGDGEFAEEGPDAELTWGEFFARLAALS